MLRKVKYSYEFKLQCVNEVLKRHLGITDVSNRWNIQVSVLKKWIRFYKVYGDIGLIPRAKNKTYTGSFKLKVVLLIKQKHISLSVACLQYNIPSVSTLITWIKKYDQHGPDILYKETRGKPKPMQFKRTPKKSNKPLTREEELLQEIELLKAENALLKKLQALIQAEEAQKSRNHKPL